MTLTILYFAWLRERIGTGEERVGIPAGVTTLDELITWLSARSDAHAAALADRTRLRAAIDGHYAPLGTAITGAREVSLFPPVTGG
ncbi:molybdopterin converting factor subunit 1 [uncultured Sphingomonas sp.]|uniref:molybdopterin converting factor subunit 1 n=1 Tax=uncultured Sphingomonas sp. TaxID=158754 RepID=UPI0025D2C30E|nr:molybdopterin converting factor subunit 1 [uncultured Sphingomonas sp.]